MVGERSDAVAKLASLAGARLKDSAALLVTAESCTGGWVAQAVTSVAGSSDWFERGFVTYSNDAKRELLGVRADTLVRHGAVSEEVACEMAVGALANSRGTIALAITGVAGPTGGTASKPVGMVCLAWVQGERLHSETQYFTGDRKAVRRQAVIRALQGVIETLDASAAQG